LGGHSLLVVKYNSEILKRFSIKLQLRELIEHDILNIARVMDSELLKIELDNKDKNALEEVEI
ncbi:hypothetical protein L1077_26515, partial [Pseudoalteromonas luteoviolacea]|uniref:hypothetical protein n=1 Tax=Pseudoalteromonas luteoviolacea TaxID=43657 RepID=UPI001F2E45D1